MQLPSQGLKTWVKYTPHINATNHHLSLLTIGQKYFRLEGAQHFSKLISHASAAADSLLLPTAGSELPLTQNAARCYSPLCRVSCAFWHSHCKPTQLSGSNIGSTRCSGASSERQPRRERRAAPAAAPLCDWARPRERSIANSPAASHRPCLGSQAGPRQARVPRDPNAAGYLQCRRGWRLPAYLWSTNLSGMSSSSSSSHLSSCPDQAEAKSPCNYRPETTRITACGSGPHQKAANQNGEPNESSWQAALRQ